MSRKDELIDWFKAFGAVTLKAKAVADDKLGVDFLDSIGSDALLIAQKIEAGEGLSMEDAESDYITMRDL